MARDLGLWTLRHISITLGHCPKCLLFFLLIKLRIRHFIPYWRAKKSEDRVIFLVDYLRIRLILGWFDRLELSRGTKERLDSRISGCC